MTRKLDKEHLDEIQTLRDSFAKNSNTLGNIAIELHVLNRQLELMNDEQTKYLNQFESLRKQESELLAKMRERYGDGQINIADGTFTPGNGLEQ
jgi:septation ring formation regulator EzrA